MKRRTILSLVVLVATLSTATAQQFQFSVTVTDGTAEQVLTLGVDPGGTDGFDEELDRSAPPAPFSGVFDARFRIGTEDFFDDIRANDLSQKTFTMRYQVASGAGPIVLTWEATGLDPLGTFEIVDDVTGALFGPLDMSTADSLDTSTAGGLLDDGLRILVVPNAPPETGDDAAKTDEGEAVVIDVLANDGDVDGTLDPATVIVTGDPSNGTITGVDPSTGAVSYDPDPGFAGIDTFTYTVADDDGASSNPATATVTINDLPEASDDVEKTGRGKPVTVDVLANDNDADGTLDPATVIVTGDPSNGTITGVDPSTGAVSYDPDPGFAGIDTFTYTVSDDDGASSNPAVVSVIVDPRELSGAIVRPDLTTPVEGVTLEMTGDLVQAGMSAPNGTYSLSVGVGGSYTVTPVKRDDDPPANGINTLDIALTRLHILGTTPFDSPFAIIAADVDNSASVNALDVVFMRLLILASTADLPGGLWRFVTSDFLFDDPTDPFPFDEARPYVDVWLDVSGQDFIAVKHGDVDASWSPPSAAQAAKAVAAAGTVHLDVGAPEEEASDKVLVPVRVRGFEDVAGLQFTLEWDAEKLAYAGVARHGLPGLQAAHFGEARAREGVLTLAWDDADLKGQTLPDGAVLFALRFHPLEDAGAPVRITSGTTAMFAHRGRDLAPLALVAEAGDARAAEAAPGRFVLEQNYPNPFNPVTTITYILPQPGLVSLKIYNALGQVVATLIDERQEAGQYQVPFDAAQLSSGIYFYTLQAGIHRATRSLMLLK